MILNEEFLNDLSKVYHENTKLNELNFHFTVCLIEFIKKLAINNSF